MKIGSICYATSRGLGHLCRDFHQHGVISDVCVVRHPGVPTNVDWYRGAPMVDLKRPDINVMTAFCDGHDAMLFFETPFAWDVIPHCRAKGIKTGIVTMYECTPEHIPPQHVPDVWLCPSLLDLVYFAPKYGSRQPAFSVSPFASFEGWGGKKAVFSPLPVEYPWRLRERAEHFVHNGGYLGVRGREGTENLIDAMQHVRSPIKLTIRVQENVTTAAQLKMARDSRIDYRPETVPYLDLYATGDVAVGAQKWNGCSLPLQEACASGMMVMNTDRFPMNTWLSKEPLIPVERYVTSRVAGRFFAFEEAVVSPLAIAAKIDEWYGKEISEYSLRGKAWAEANSWEALKPAYLEALA